MSRNPVLIDTAFVTALINRRDQHHERARQLASIFENRPLVVTDVILLEIGNSLARHFRVEAVAILDEFLTSDDVQVVRLTPALFERALALYRLHRDNEWGMIDCVSFVVMKDMGLRSALTFDNHFVQAGFQALMKD